MDEGSTDNASFVKAVAKHCQSYKGADIKRSSIQLIVTLVLFFVTVSLMIYATSFSYLLVALLLLPAAGLLTRIFIFQHDCGHGAFWKSREANDWTGRFLSLLTVTPYGFWRKAHNIHHALSGDLSRRSIGGMETITVNEYQRLSRSKQRAYRIYRNPFILLIIGTPLFIILGQRTPFFQSTAFFEDYKKLSLLSISKSIMPTNLALVVFYSAIAFFVGWLPLLAVYLPILIVTAWAGGWLFYIQHQFENTYWEGSDKWSVQEAALMGSSHYALPKVLQWFTGNIGIHHIHHLCAKIPNYKLQECMDAKPELQTVNRLTIRESLKCINFKLWDEEKNQLVPFPAV